MADPKGPHAAGAQISAPLGVHTDVNFLYAVPKERALAGHGIYNHGQVKEIAPNSTEFCPLTTLDRKAMRNPTQRSMAQRCAAERQTGVFGISLGNETKANVRRLSGA